MKTKKLFTLGIVVPMFAMCVSCNRGIEKISFDQAISFAVKNYDQYHHVGFSPDYKIRVNTLALKDTKIYSKVEKDDFETYEQVYYIDTTMRDLTTTIDRDEFTTMHVNSTTVRQVASYVSIANALLGYFESSFTLEDDKYLGIYLTSNKLEQVVNIAGGALALLSTGVIEDFVMDYFELLTASSASLKLTASCNNLGLFDRAHLYLALNGVSMVLGDDLQKFLKSLDLDKFGVITSKQIALDLDFIVDYSNK